jgi:hypothetical protein
MKILFRVPIGWSLLVVGLITLLMAFGPSRARANSAAAARFWKLVPSPNVPGVGQGLYAVTAVSGADAWVAGDVYNQAAGAQQTLTQHWDGTRWQTVPSPSVSNAYNHLTGVAASSSNDVWAVGYTIEKDTNAWQALILHWNGNSSRTCRYWTTSCRMLMHASRVVSVMWCFMFDP